MSRPSATTDASDHVTLSALAPKNSGPPITYCPGVTFDTVNAPVASVALTAGARAPAMSGASDRSGTRRPARSGAAVAPVNTRRPGNEGAIVSGSWSPLISAVPTSIVLAAYSTPLGAPGAPPTRPGFSAR